MEILSNRQEKLIRSLQQKKYRKQEQLFVVEGKKLVEEALRSEFEVEMILLTKEEYQIDTNINTYLIEENRMKKLSSLTTSPGILAVLKQRRTPELIHGGVLLMLDKVQDPGNLGTIIRTADAFGIQTIICSKDTVDFFSPKVIQSTMGAIFRMNIHYLNLVEFIKENETEYKVYGTHLRGKNIYEEKLDSPAIIIMGNESNGISNDLMEEVSHPINIPIEEHAESFNVSIATAIVLSEFKRRDLIP